MLIDHPSVAGSLRSLAIAACPIALAAVTTPALAGSRPTVIITVENLAPDAGTYQTPVWIGLHGGGFDSYDSGAPASMLPIMGSDALERIAEDGNPGPIIADFAALMPGGVQGVVTSNGPIPPLGPGQSASRLFDIDPDLHRYLSYVSMVIPSNDAFIANGDPIAHELFDADGDFVGAPFMVMGGAVNDAGTEVNDEIPAHTAFFGQMMPDAGVPEGGTVSAHPGFLMPGAGGILDDPAFANADFLAPGYAMMRVNVTYFDAARKAKFESDLDASQETDPVKSDGNGRGRVKLQKSGTRLKITITARDLTGDVTDAHLHLAPFGQAGPVVVNLSDGIKNKNDKSEVKIKIHAEDVVGPLAGTDDPFGNLIAELVSGGIYINLHTEAYPGGEIRGQLHMD